MKNTVTEEQIHQMLAASEKEVCTFHGKELIVSYKLECGFTISGRSACVDPENFNLEIGEKLCFEDAKKQLWQLEGYRLQWQLYETGKL